MKVYLSGGFRSGWQDVVKQQAGGCEFIDPREHGLEDEHQYTLLDLAGIDVCDVVFAILEQSNDRPLGLCVEVGYAHGRGKTIILVDERSDDHLAGMVRGCANVTVSSLGRGIKLLAALYRQQGGSSR